MHNNNDYDTLEYLLFFLAENFDLWKTFKGQKIKHNNYGSGVIEDVDINNFDNKPRLSVRFDYPADKIEYYNEFPFKKGILHFTGLDFSDIDGFNEYVAKKKEEEIEKQEQVLKEAKSVEEYDYLKAKYGIANKSSLPISSPLYSILQKLEFLKPLNRNDSEWLEKNIPSVYYEQKYIWMDDLWDLVKSCKHWRKLEEPQRVIKLLESKSSTNDILMSAILNVMGAAYRDINDIETAEVYANMSIKHNISFYPYSLLGAIYYQKGLPAIGDKHFHKAKELGSKLDLSFMLKEALLRAEEGERVLSARYLLKKDSWKYKWAEKYTK
jgi:hypothetical protein